MATPSIPWMQTYSGGVFTPGDPQLDQINIEDIAHALSNVCRYNGHARSFYSVAQHSILVSMHVPPEDALWGLLHDASEAYIADIPSPVKRLPEMAGYMALEGRIMAAVCDKFGLPREMPASVKEADYRMLLTEKRDVCMPGQEWGLDGEPYETVIAPMPPTVSRHLFITRFLNLTKNK